MHFEDVPWKEYDEGRATRPMGLEFVLVERGITGLRGPWFLDNYDF